MSLFCLLDFIIVQEIVPFFLLFSIVSSHLLLAANGLRIFYVAVFLFF